MAIVSPYNGIQTQTSSFQVAIKKRPETQLGKARHRNGLKRRCVTMVRQHRARLYILRRCISMLLCWHHHSVRD